MELHWKPITHYSYLMSENPDKDELSGVYVWGFNSKGRFIPYYGGKARYLKWRITDHISNILGINYSLFDEKSINDESFGKENIKYWAEHYAHKTDIIFNHRNELKKHIEFMVDKFYFTYAPISLEDYNAYATDAEKAVIKWLNLTERGNTRGGVPSQEIILGNIDNVIQDFKALQGH